MDDFENLFRWCNQERPSHKAKHLKGYVESQREDPGLRKKTTKGLYQLCQIDASVFPQIWPSVQTIINNSNEDFELRQEVIDGLIALRSLDTLPTSEICAQLQFIVDNPRESERLKQTARGALEALGP
ncbi:MAG: hypothetical protein ROO73_01445 [Roseivirga sp.]